MAKGAQRKGVLTRISDGRCSEKGWLRNSAGGVEQAREGRKTKAIGNET